MIRKHKKYSRPRKPFDTVRIKAENDLVNRYGLKNKREIWKAKAKLDSIRNRAKELLRESSEEKQKLFLDKLSKLGYKVEEVVDVLALTEENVLNRRLQTVILKKGITTTTKGARQLITHKHISIDNKIVNIPSYHVIIDEEKNIKKVEKVKPIKKEEKKVEDIANVKTDEKMEEGGKVSNESNEGISKVKNSEIKEEKLLEVSVNG